MSDIDTAEMRDKLDRYGDPGIAWFNETCYAAFAEIDRLRARLAEVEAEVADRKLVTTSLGDQMRMWHGKHDEEHARAEAAEARLAAVRALCDVDDGDVVQRHEVRAAAAGDRAEPRPAPSVFIAGKSVPPNCECGHTMYDHTPGPVAVENILRLTDADPDRMTWPCLVCNCKTWQRSETAGDDRG